MRSRTILWLGALSTALLFLACGAREHLTPSHGKSVSAALAQQKVEKDPKKTAKAADGLDPLEASIIAGSYHKSLAPAGTAAAEPQVLIVSPEEQ